MERFEHKKSLGQHFLNSDYVPKKMCDAAGEISGKTVLEIGPGTGILTKEILARGAKVIAVEADERAIASLEKTFADAIARQQLTIHHHDARNLNLEQLGLEKHSYIVISNIPYYLSGLLFRQLLDTEIQPETLVFLIQKELAERIAQDSKESLLSLSIKAFGEPTYIGTIPKGHFTPPPKVDSAIIAVRGISHTYFDSFRTTDFFHVLHLGFQQKRKQLQGNLAQTYDRELVISALKEAKILETARAEDIHLSEWKKIISTLLSTK